MTEESSKNVSKEELSSITGNIKLLEYVVEGAAENAKKAVELATESISTIKDHSSKIEFLLSDNKESKKSTENLVSRISRLENSSEIQEQNIISLIQEQKTLNDALLNIQKTMIQIKWTAYGALGMFVLESFGLKEILKKIFLN